VTSDPGLRFRVVGVFTDLAEKLVLAGWQYLLLFGAVAAS